MGSSETPILISIETDKFWAQVRSIVREELQSLIAYNKLPQKSPKDQDRNDIQYKPLYDMKEMRQLFSNVSRTTIYEWVKCGKLKLKKMKGKIYFLWSDIEVLLKQL